MQIDMKVTVALRETLKNALTWRKAHMCGAVHNLANTLGDRIKSMDSRGFHLFIGKENGGHPLPPDGENGGHPLPPKGEDNGGYSLLPNWDNSGYPFHSNWEGNDGYPLPNGKENGGYPLPPNGKNDGYLPGHVEEEGIATIIPFERKG